MPNSEPHPGLCAECVHCHRISTARGTIFYLCRRAETEVEYVRYPPLPVRACRGYEATGDSSTPRRQ